jgi:hypothetical protein
LRDAALSPSNFDDFPEERGAPRRRGAGPVSAQPAPTPGRAARKKPSVLARVFAPRRMGALLLLGIGGLAFVGVPMNALFLQDGHHPAPLFSARVATPQKTEVAGAPAETARIETGAARPDAKPEALKTEIAPTAAKPPKSDAAALKAMLAKPEAAPAAKPEKKREVAPRDPIAAMLGGAEAPAKPASRASAKPAFRAPAEPPVKPKAQAQTSAAQTHAPIRAQSRAPTKNQTQTLVQTQAPSADVAAAQRALQRLGYVVKPDGAMSAGTRQAIERFERENGLSAKGELTPKVAKLIAARAAAARQ